MAKSVLTSKGSCSLSKIKKTKIRITQKRYSLSTATFYVRSFMERHPSQGDGVFLHAKCDGGRKTVTRRRGGAADCAIFGHGAL